MAIDSKLAIVKDARRHPDRRIFIPTAASSSRLPRRAVRNAALPTASLVPRVMSRGSEFASGKPLSGEGHFRSQGRTFAGAIFWTWRPTWPPCRVLVDPEVD